MSVLGLAVTFWTATTNSFAFVCKSLKLWMYNIRKTFAAWVKTGSPRLKPKSRSWNGKGVPWKLKKKCIFYGLQVVF